VDATDPVQADAAVRTLLDADRPIYERLVRQTAGRQARAAFDHDDSNDDDQRDEDQEGDDGGGGGGGGAVAAATLMRTYVPSLTVFHRPDAVARVLDRIATAANVQLRTG
jgi:hypothetical protein